MIKYCIEKWDKNKDILRSALGNNKLLNHVLNKNGVLKYKGGYE